MDPWDFAQPRFRKYYQSVKVAPPSELQQREFAFMLTGKKGMWRHIGFRDEASMQRFMADKVPAHSYYSTAYYKDPGGPTMDKKGWLGADLIFDLDADHIQGADKMTFPEMLEEVKKEFAKLLDSFILGDFGFDADKVEVVFSGGRGYHAHVTDERVRRLGGHERREIVDYISGTGLDVNTIFPEASFAQKGKGKFQTVIKKRSLREGDVGGWANKIYKEISPILIQLSKMDKKDAIRELSQVKGIGEGWARGIYKDLFEAPKNARGMDMLLNGGKIAENLSKGRDMADIVIDEEMKDNDAILEIFSKQQHLNKFVDYVIKVIKVELEGEADEPVTSDIKRLIRLPGSLHAKTGFVSLPMSIDALKGFDPFEDAIPPTLTDAPVKLKGLRDAKYKLAGEEFSVAVGKEFEAPERAALFLVCSKNCEPVAASPA